MNSILVTGGAGFIGSHMCGYLIKNNRNIIVIDNLSNSNLTNLKILEIKFKKKIVFYNEDICNIEILEKIFTTHNISSLIHFAALKSVSESNKYKDMYYRNNVYGSELLFSMCKKYKVKNIIFSSSATVYGNPKYLPIDEQHTINPINYYGITKVETEKLLLKDNYFSESCSTKILRYFNPIGSFDNSIIGESPRGIPNNLMPYVISVAKKENSFLKVYGNDYDTHDGTGVRDYIHIMDLIKAHFLCLNFRDIGNFTFNLGTGNGFSVLDLLKTFERVNKIKIPIKVVERRDGDVDKIYACPQKAKKILNWVAQYDLDKMCKDSWNYALKNNNGL